MIAQCPNCKPHEFQDKTYGRNMRVFNPCQKPGGRSLTGYRCTICGNKIGLPKSQVEKEKDK